MDITELTMSEQQEVEKLFAANLFLDPLTTLRECGWLPSEIIRNEGIRDLWQRSKERINLSEKPEDAQAAVTQIATEVGCLLDVMKDVTMLYTGRPDAYAQEIMNRARNVRLTVKLTETINAVRQNEHEKVDGLITEIGGMTRTQIGKVRTADDIHQNFIEFLYSRAGSVETSIPNFDEALGGLPRRNLTVIGARPSMGKTAIAWQIARDTAHDNHVAFFSLEMSEIDLWLRVTCPEAGVNYRDVMARRISEVQLTSLVRESEVIRELYGDRLMVDDRAQTTMTIWQYVASHRPDLVIVDHLRLLRDKGEKGSTENKRQGMLTHNLKDMAKAFNCAVLVLAQLNRQVEATDKKRPSLSDLRDSGEIEENADLVILIHSPDFYAEEMRSQPKRGVDLIVEKNRNGVRMAKIALLYDLVKQRFTPAVKNTTELNR